jgi:hypothetical protein
MNIRSWAKACTGCGLEKAAEHFGVLKKAKDGRNTRCRVCVAAYGRQFYREHPEYYADRKADNAARSLKSWRTNKTTRMAAQKARREAGIEAVRARERASKRREYVRRRDVILARVKAWNTANRDKRLAYTSQPQMRLHGNVSRAIRSAIRLNKAGRGWELLVGYTRDQLVRHIEAQFSIGMSWDNYGEWEIDHIKPRAAFTFTTAEDAQFRECWALRNLQPLWMVDNRRKWAHHTGTAA